MKKSILYLSLFFISLLVISGCFKEEINELSNEDLLNIIKPEIDIYCDTLDSEATYSGCPACKGWELDTFQEVSELPEISSAVNYNEYTMDKVDGDYILNINLNIFYGWNTHTGHSNLSFVIDKESNIIDKYLQEKECL